MLLLGGVNGRYPPRFTGSAERFIPEFDGGAAVRDPLLLGGVNGRNPPRFTGSAVRFIPELDGGAAVRDPLLFGGVNGRNPPRFTGCAVRFVPEFAGATDRGPSFRAYGLYPLRFGICAVRFPGLLICRPPPCRVPALGFCAVPIPPRIAVD